MNWLPGPWVCNFTEQQHWRIEQLLGYIVGRTYTAPDEKGNARLMAAAPDLYEALEKCEKHLRELCESYEGTAEDEEIAEIALTALAKARGEANVRTPLEQAADKARK